MSSSGEYLFDPQLAEAVDEAFERCGIDPMRLSGRHIKSARRSINLLMTEWHNRGINQFMTERVTIKLVVGQAEYVLPDGTSDLLDVTYNLDGADTPLWPIGRTDYSQIPNKLRVGRPDRYFVHRKSGVPTLYLWLTPDNGLAVLDAWRLRQSFDASGASQTMDAPWRFQDALAAGLAAKLAVKWAPEKKNALREDAEQAIQLARLEDRERGVCTLQPVM